MGSRLPWAAPLALAAASSCQNARHHGLPAPQMAFSTQLRQRLSSSSLSSSSATRSSFRSAAARFGRAADGPRWGRAAQRRSLATLKAASRITAWTCMQAAGCETESVGAQQPPCDCPACPPSCRPRHLPPPCLGPLPACCRPAAPRRLARMSVAAAAATEQPSEGTKTVIQKAAPGELPFPWSEKDPYKLPVSIDRVQRMLVTLGERGRGSHGPRGHGTRSVGAAGSRWCVPCADVCATRGPGTTPAHRASASPSQHATRTAARLTRLGEGVGGADH
jgi:hypothetical protein